MITKIENGYLVTTPPTEQGGMPKQTFCLNADKVCQVIKEMFGVELKVISKN